MATVSKVTEEQVADIEAILRLMAKHEWTTLTISARGFTLAGDSPGSSWVHGSLKGDDE